MTTTQITARLRTALDVPGRSLPEALAAATYGAVAEAHAGGMTAQEITALRDAYADVAASMQSSVSSTGRVVTSAR